MDILRRTKAAWPSICNASAEDKNRLLSAMADSLQAECDAILRCNAEDMDAARGHISDVMLDRLALTQARIHAMADGIREAAARGLSNYRTTPDCMPHLLDRKNVSMLTSHGVFSEAELKSRCEIMLENYSKVLRIEALTMLEMVNTDILPAVSDYTAKLVRTAEDKKALLGSAAGGYEQKTAARLSSLTEIASESYKTFVADLQSDIKTVLYDRPTVATSEYFKGKYVKVDDVPTLIDDEKANAIEFYLIQNGYVDMKRKVTDKYRQDIKNGTVAKLPEELGPIADGIHTLIQAVYDDSVLKDMFSDGHETKVKDNPLNENFAKREFQALWREINHKYAYTVDFDSTELIRKAIAHIDEKLFVSELQYTTTIGRQKTEMNEYEIERGASFTGEKTRTKTLKHAETSQIKYDLIGKIAEGTVLTRRTVSAILQGIRVDKLYMFKNNPEEFITKVIRLINEQKATMIVEHISYDTIEGEYDSSIFTAEKATQSFDKAFLAKKAIQDYVFTDGSADKSIERKFAEDLDAADEVCVYAKLPRTFQIPTPVGNYSPDWAIAFYEGTVKHIFFIAETKGTMESLELRPIEQAKISCAKKLFNEMSTSNVVYHDVDSYQSLLNIMNSI